jgi:hypothetical protein
VHNAANAAAVVMTDVTGSNLLIADVLLIFCVNAASVIVKKAAANRRRSVAAGRFILV